MKQLIEKTRMKNTASNDTQTQASVNNKLKGRRGKRNQETENHNQLFPGNKVSIVFHQQIYKNTTFKF